MDQPRPQVQTTVEAVHTIPDLSPDGLDLVLFFMGFILLVLGLDLMVKLIIKWRLLETFIKDKLKYSFIFFRKQKTSLFSRAVWAKMNHDEENQAEEKQSC